MHEPIIEGPVSACAQRMRLSWIVSMLMILLVACGGSDPEQALRQQFAGLQQAVSEQDPAAVQQFLADDFIGNDGLDRSGARRLVSLHALRFRDVSATAGPLQIQLEGDHARVRFTVALTGGSGGLLPESGRVLSVESGWRQVDGDWLMTSAQWRDGI